ncbi:hypothetical protein RB653_005838 [Dictyostelium firmibasis]|uniref:Uncharacterized protein n=1 Tax=Dictyostelium firmibasis TaxID=79012 RepID=A0AAN7UAX4_9MYCE
MDKYLMSPSFLCDQRDTQDYFQGCFSNFHNNTYYQKQQQQQRQQQQQQQPYQNYYNQNIQQETYQHQQHQQQQQQQQQEQQQQQQEQQEHQQQQFIYDNKNLDNYSQNQKSNKQFIFIDQSLIEACKDAVKSKEVEEVEEIDEEGIPIIDVPVTNSVFYRNDIK